MVGALPPIKRVWDSMHQTFLTLRWMSRWASPDFELGPTSMSRQPFARPHLALAIRTLSQAVVVSAELRAGQAEERPSQVTLGQG
jgi:hypothetical protein